MQLTYYDEDGPTWGWWGRPPVGEEPDPPPDDIHTIAHGYNLGDLDRLARIAASRTVGGSTSISDRYDHARSAIAEHLLTAATRPDPRDMLRAGGDAIVRHAAQEWHHHGYSRKRDDVQANYARYWRWVSARTPSHEDGVIDRAALWQIWPALSERHREVLLVLAAAGDTDAAADRLGLTAAAAKCRVQRARAAFARLWHEHETPPARTWRRAPRRTGMATDGRLGKARVTASQVEDIRARVWRGERQRDIAADYGVGQSTVGRLLRGRSLPAPDPEEETDE